VTGAKEVRSQHAHDEWTLRGLPLPGHVIVLTQSGWLRGWLLSRENSPTGWTGLVQYEEGGVELIEYLPAERIASPDVWLTK
jgi:hypothetical protein